MIPTLFLLKFHISQKNALCFKPTSPFCCWFCPETSHLHNQLRLQAKSQVFLHLRIVRRSFVSYPFWSVSIDESVCIRFAIGYDAMNVPMKKIKPKKEADVENPPKKCEQTANRWRINPILRPDLFGHLVEDVPTKLPFWMSPWSCYKLGDGCWLNHDIHSCTPTRMAKVCCRFSGLHSKNHKYIDFHGGYSTFWFWKTYGWFMWGLGVLEQVHHSHVPQKKKQKLSQLSKKCPTKKNRSIPSATPPSFMFYKLFGGARSVFFSNVPVHPHLTWGTARYPHRSSALAEPWRVGNPLTTTAKGCQQADGIKSDTIMGMKMLCYLNYLQWTLLIFQERI